MSLKRWGRALLADLFENKTMKYGMELVPEESPQTTAVPAGHSQNLWTLSAVKSKTLILQGVLGAPLFVINKA